MAFNLAMLASPLAPKSNRGDFDFTKVIGDIGNRNDRLEQNKITNERNAASDIRAEKLSEMQISQFKETVRRNNKTEAMTDYAGYIARSKALLEDGDLDGFKALSTARIADLEERGKSDPTTNSVNTQGLLDLATNNPEALGRSIGAEASALVQTGFLKSATDINGKSGLQANAPVTLVSKTDPNDKILAFPVFDKTTSEARYEEIDSGEYELSTETPLEKRMADVAAKQQEVIEALQARQEMEPQIKADTLLAEADVKKADQAFSDIDKIRTNNQNLQTARQALIDGAGSGPIESLIPSLRAQSIRLDAAQGRLGLDVVQSTTFGALSKGELDLSKAIALPKGLDEPDLVKWIDDKITANNMMANYLERQAVFLSGKNEDGKQNTKADWVQSERAAMDAALTAFEVTEEDIQETMRANGMDRSDVLIEIRRRFENGGS